MTAICYTKDFKLVSSSWVDVKTSERWDKGENLITVEEEHLTDADFIKILLKLIDADGKAEAFEEIKCLLDDSEWCSMYR